MAISVLLLLCLHFHNYRAQKHLSHLHKDSTHKVLFTGAAAELPAETDDNECPELTGTTSGPEVSSSHTAHMASHKITSSRPQDTFRWEDKLSQPSPAIFDILDRLGNIERNIETLETIQEDITGVQDAAHDIQQSMADALVRLH